MIRSVSLLGLTAILAAALSPAAAHAQSSKVREADKQAARDTPQYYYPETPFDPELMRRQMLPGDATIRGVLFHTVSDFGGKPGPLTPRTSKPAEGVTVFLVPATPYIVEWRELFIKQRRRNNPKTGLGLLVNGLPNNRVLKYDPRVEDYMLSAVADKYGRFAFSGLLPGKYYITAESTVSGSYQDTEVAGTSTAVNAFGVPYTVQHTRPVTRSYRTPLFMDSFVIIPPNKAVVEVDAKLK